jgi:hypothetical protein
MQLRPINLIRCFFIGVLMYGFSATAQELYPVPLKKEAWHGEQRKLRYHPEGGDFVITNGNRRFNRALYGTNTAFRVEAGDLPEFAFYMPGMGGNLKFGLLSGNKSIWLIDARKITARYTPGSMHYEITDPLLGKGKLHLVILAMADAEGLVLQTWFEGTEKNIELLTVFGGASGKKFSRMGDMGPDPESSFYLHPEDCATNVFDIKGAAFHLKYGKGQTAALDGLFPAPLKLADAMQLGDAAGLYRSTASGTPVVTGKKKLVSGEKLYVVIKNPESKPGEIQYASAAGIFAAAETARQKIAGRIRLNTPDAYINTVGGALSIASDGIWEDPSYMHGAIGWRMRLDGWRGPYTADPLGWHDRARTHLEAYAKSQVTTPLTGPVVPDTAFHLARHTEKMGTSMFTSGYISRDPDGKNLRPHHYDMNLVYTDELLWHFNWTGDLAFVKKMWPVLQRHLEWEKRNFDPDNDGLYDAYAAIWASDALYYSGGGVTHSSAYNYRANRMAARIAALIGENPEPYDKEATKILKAINTNLWLTGKGVYAEYKDGLGLKAQHPSAALWTIYHSLDSDIADPFQAYQSLQYVDHEIPHIPVRAAGLPDGQYYTLSTSSWMPYVWSINNVVMAESMHTALANWEAGRNEEAFKLFKSEILAGMYLGGSPGNFVQISYYDAIRGESYRDFGDPVGISSRALVEGLFGIVPDALNKVLHIRPGIPQSWDHADITIPDLDFKFKRKGNTDSYRLKLSFMQPLALRLQVKARGNGISSITVNGKKATWKNADNTVGLPVIEINAAQAKAYDIQILWKGQAFEKPAISPVYALGDVLTATFGSAQILKINDPQQIFTDAQYKGNKFNARLSGETGNRTAFVQLKSGEFTWWYPLCFELKAPATLLPVPVQEKNSLQFRVVNNSIQPLKGELSLADFKKEINLPAGDTSAMVTVTGGPVQAGSNNLLLTRADGSTTALDIINWNVTSVIPGQRTIDLSGVFNDKVTQIFRNKYLSPRPTAGPTLQLPWQGIGDWPNALAKADIDDSGLRKLAGSNNEIVLPQGIKFKTPGEAGKQNILFTSQWDNYPVEKEVPLSGTAGHAYFLMAGSTNHMQSQFDNGKIVITYTDGSSSTLVLRNPETWWPIQEDYYTDDFAFKLKSPRPVRIHLKTGVIISGTAQASRSNHQTIDGGAATVLDLALDSKKTLKSLTLKTLANDVVIGLMGVTFTQ